MGVIRQQRSRFLDYLLPGHAASRSLDRARCGNSRQGQLQTLWQQANSSRQSPLAQQVMAESHWIEADRERFAALLQAERSEVPEFTESTIHVVAGLLLPIWKTAAERVDTRLPSPDQRGRAHHRQKSLAGMGRQRASRRGADA
jgi:hypothetical protein